MINDVKDIGGIIQPIFENRFRVDFSDDKNTDYGILTAMLITVDTKFKSNHNDFGLDLDEGEANLVIELAPAITYALNQLYKNTFNMKVISFDGSAEEYKTGCGPTEVLNNCRVKEAMIGRSYMPYKEAGTVRAFIKVSVGEYYLE
jgi:hypothetical protein